MQKNHQQWRYVNNKTFGIATDLNPPIRQYHLSAMQISQQNLSQIIAEIQKNEHQRKDNDDSILHILFWNNFISFRGIKMLAKISWSHLVCLDLFNNQLGSKGCKNISKSQWPSLKTLGLSTNMIGNQGCKYLSKGHWPKLFKLDLGTDPLTKVNNRIFYKGCTYLYRSYRPQLQILQLYENDITIDGAKLFVSMEYEVESVYQYRL